MNYDTIGRWPKAEPNPYTIEDLIILGLEFPNCVITFLGTDYYPESLASWRGNFPDPSITYGDTPITGEELSELLKEQLTQSHEGFKGNNYTFKPSDQFYVANYGEVFSHRVVGFKFQTNEIVLLTKVTYD